jgi:capsular exopolysaccharide synthesis family protein
MNKFSKALQKAEEEKQRAKAAHISPGAEVPPSLGPVSGPTSDMSVPQSTTPSAQSSGRFVIKGAAINPRIIAYHDPRSRISEQYRVLRTNLKTLKKNSLKVILISSSIESEGKTVTALNLAFTLAQDATKKILLIDGDLRKGKVGCYLGLKKKLQGLCDVIENRCTLEDVIVETPYKNLHILPGNMTNKLDNAAELLGSQVFKKILADIREEYDCVIIDSPPIIPVTDACVLGAQVDGVIMAVQAGRTPRATVLHAQTLFEQAQVPLLGYILTSVEYISPGYRDYYYYSYN